MAVRTHRRVNNLPEIPDLETRVEEQICEKLPHGHCEYDDPNRRSRVTKGLTFKDVLRTGRMLVEWHVKFGREVVPQEQAEKRAETCSRCPLRGNIAGCGGCEDAKDLKELVARMVGERKTAADAYLGTCAVCGCALKAKIWLPYELLLKYSGEVKLEDFPDHCWMRTEEVKEEVAATEATETLKEL